MTQAPPIVELINVSKRFGKVMANHAISWSVQAGEVHSLLGENGAGKSTLMKILFGMYRPDSGQIVLRGKNQQLRSPKDAIALGLGMVHQHFMLVGRMRVWENIIAGAERSRWGHLDARAAQAAIEALSARYGLEVPSQARIEDLSVGVQQRVEILKALYRQADILILDEPTAVLTPQESRELFAVIRQLKAAGKTVILITHKLQETMAIADRVTVLRDGQLIDTLAIADSSPPLLARKMVGREVLLRVDKPAAQPGALLLELRNLHLGNALQEVSLQLRRGEIVGIAGVEGNGQLELEEALLGLNNAQGEILFYPDTFAQTGKAAIALQHSSTAARRAAGIAHIPSDRLRRGIIGQFSVAWNFILGSQRRFTRAGLLHSRRIHAQSDTHLRAFDVRAASWQLPAAALSGGNQQKLVLARELSRDPALIVACQPTRGVDVGAIEFIHRRLLELRAAGKGIVLISAELEEIRALSDRILVLYEGRIIAECPAGSSEEQLGLLMAGQLPEQTTAASSGQPLP